MRNIDYIRSMPAERLSLLLVNRREEHFEDLDCLGGVDPTLNVVTYETSDGLVFDRLENAQRHEVYWLMSEHESVQ